MFQILLSRELSLFLIVFLVTHMFPFFSVRSFRARFFIERYEKAPRAVRGSFSASFDGMILTHFYVARIRDFRHDGDDCAFLIGSNLLHRSADSSTCCCQVHTQVFQSLPKRKLNLFSMFFFVAHTFPFFSVRSFCARFFLSDDTKKPLAPCAGAPLYLSTV